MWCRGGAATPEAGLPGDQLGSHGGRSERGRSALPPGGCRAPQTARSCRRPARRSSRRSRMAWGVAGDLGEGAGQVPARFCGRGKTFADSPLGSDVLPLANLNSSYITQLTFHVSPPLLA